MIADPQNEFNRLIATLQENYPALDLDLIKLAFDFAGEAHAGQKRVSGEPYIIHSLATAQKLAELNVEPEIVIAGLLHDVPEDTKFSLADVEKNFGAEIAGLVGGVTKLGTLKYRGIERYAENLRKMFVAMSNDIRVILIKFADRLHNLKTLAALPRDKQLRIARESLEIYAPIADRLGASAIKGELEDLAFKHIYPEEYVWLDKILSQEYKNKENDLILAKETVAKTLLQNNIRTVEPIHGRTKHLYSLYKKLLRPQIDRHWERIHDLIALRIIVRSVGDCYSTLGVLHNLYRPLPGRVKDYIAQPKPNGYQSLHTTIFTKEGKIIEFQIRTLKMHREAEFGIAAHWHYKEKGGNFQNPKWLKELVEWQKQIKDSQQFLQDVKLEFFKDQIFVFTPRGDVIELPEQSTPIDFAYYVHSDLGNSCIGARVNDQLVSLDSKLKSGDIVEIIINKSRQKPNLDWLNLVKTSMARNKIRIALKKNKEA